ncbi:pilus assembly protein [Variovorax sp. LT1R16]|uniref:pilus assembly protein n=1 Tax=Variovorax sp. LT1R16 TaxID=3443728 RepID=UPI003F4669F0
MLAAEPLFATTARVKPNMVLDLSVAYPTTGAAYRGEFDLRKTYIGYWDPMGCYDYAAADGFFRRGADASESPDGIVCVNQWSGNMLNWAASSAIDMLRYAMTGGDRVIDTADTTVLQRAVLPDDFYNAERYFPARTLRGRLDQLTPLVASGQVRANGSVRIANCRDRLFVGSATRGHCDAPGANQAYGPGGAAPYLARVQVCSGAEGTTRRDLCFRYPSGQAKPVGALQTYADKMRFAVFGYLTDNTNARYGGVLRAPMKFTGPNGQNERFEKIANEAAEWDATSGVFVRNPLAASEGLSGVANYLNQFGRTGPVAGTYKGLDPVGELYYESLRYLQGQPPSEPAAAGMTAAMKDGFPVYNQSRHWGVGDRALWDPVVEGCQRNQVLAIGDLNTHHDQSLPGLRNDGLDGWPSGIRTPDPARMEPDTAHWSRIVGAFENNESLAYTHPSGKPGLRTRGNADGPRAFAYRSGTQISAQNMATLGTGASAGSLGWAGLAYWAHTQQIRSDHPALRVKTYTIDVDERGDGTLRRAQRGSAYYLAAKYGAFDDRNQDGNPFVTASGVGGEERVSNAEWQSGVDDDGFPKPRGYFLASRPQEMIAAIREIFRSAAAPSGTTAGGAIASHHVARSGTQLYIPQFDSSTWSGSLLAYPLHYDAASGAVSKGATPIWNAGERLTGHPEAVPPVAARDPASRRIFTQRSTGQGAEFLWEALSADAPLRAALDRVPDSQMDERDGLGEARVAYLRGDRRREGHGSAGVFRMRDSVMGDIVNAAPLQVGAPSAALQGPAYADFLVANRARRQAVYVGANDGMLHAFAADDGSELFAYVPRAVFDRLGAYASPAYVHQPYVDGSPVAGEVLGTDGQWKTMLVSGMGGGARGVFALDVSTPERFAASQVRWEFSGADDADMGHVTQAPRLLKFRTTAARNGKAATYRWFAVVPSGFNNANASRAGALFLLSLDKAPGEPWVMGSNYHKVLLPAPVDTTRVNALGPVGDYAGADRATRWLYAGDTQGNLWKFDFANDAPWTAANALALSGAPLMVAQDAAGLRQPITVPPEVGVGPNGGAILLFGTGKWVEADDVGSRGVQSIYAVHDNGQAIPGGGARTQLQSRRVTSEGDRFRVTGDAFAYGRYSDKTAQRRGWYFDLPNAEDQGERLVSRMVLSDGQLFFNTLIPQASTCSAGGGGHHCAVEAMTGLSAGLTCLPSTVGMPSAPLVVQAGDGAFARTDAFGRRTETKKVEVVSIGTGPGDAPGVSIDRPLAGGKIAQVAGRLNWRRVLHFKDLKK